ncbi:MAG: hypothetical protein FJY98_04520 [Candidatus Liptonbacteria bacterium]|nr:hypothetical protein [Candidatus Liptonbacteria bacterium]
MQLKILSWNIWGGQHYREIVETLRAINPDILGLQEAIQDLNGKNNTAEMIAKELGYEWAYLPSYEVETARLYTLLEPKTVHIGNAVLSKYKIKETRSYQLSEIKERFALQAIIPIQGNDYNIFSTHLVHTHQLPSEIQDLQTQKLITCLPKEKSVVMGDFNATPESNSFKMMRETMRNSDETLKPTWSVYPEGCEICTPQRIDTRLDYIFTSPDIAATSPTVHDSKGADHLPISVTLELQ